MIKLRLGEFVIEIELQGCLAEPGCAVCNVQDMKPLAESSWFEFRPILYLSDSQRIDGSHGDKIRFYFINGRYFDRC